MQFVAYIVLYPLLWIISCLPFRLLYIVSDVVYFIMFYVVKYRKKTVSTNLRLVFPNKTTVEINTITKKFYKHLCDMFLEMIKTMTISKKELHKRFVIENPEVLKELENLNKSCIAMYGHYASYEWTLAIQNYLKKFKGIGIYKRIVNPYFDKLVKRIRSKYNTELIDTKKATATLKEYEKRGIKSITAFISDQSPKYRKNLYWSSFMGIQIPCFVGAEVTAKKYDSSVVYFKINKVKRGYYTCNIVVLAKNSCEFSNFEITEKFTRELEKQINQAPEYYLWTHKRWKHKDKNPL